ncbi:MAG: response regulator transcription factor [Chloroflexota bacterium]
MSKKNLRILIADDHAIVREGIAAVINMEPGLELAGEAINGREAVALAEALQPDLILMDMAMPVLDGLGAIREIKQAQPELPILVLTSYADDDRVFPAIKHGALGYLLKDTPRKQLIQAIIDVAAGQVSLHPQIAAKLMNELDHPPSNQKPTEAPLTERELDTLRLVAQGLSNQEIGERLQLSPHTISRHVNNILSKLHLANRTQAALYALHKGLASLGPELDFL